MDPNDEADKLNDYIRAVEKACETIEPKSDKPSLPDIAAMWGLPTQAINCSNYGPKGLLRVCAVAAYTTALFTA